MATSDNNEWWKEFYGYSRFITGLILIPLVGGIGISGNVLSIVLLLSRELKKISVNVILIALAVSDTMKLLNDMMYFLLLLRMSPKKILSGDEISLEMTIFYKYAHYFNKTFTTVTVWLTTLIAIERYITCALSPSTARRIFSPKHNRIIIAGIYLSAAIITVPSLLTLEVRYICNNGTMATMSDNCSYTVVNTRLDNQQMLYNCYIWIVDSLRSIAPLFFTSLLYILIIRRLRQSIQRSKRKKAKTVHFHVETNRMNETNSMLYVDAVKNRRQSFHENCKKESRNNKNKKSSKWWRWLMPTIQKNNNDSINESMSEQIIKCNCHHFNLFITKSRFKSQLSSGFIRNANVEIPVENSVYPYNEDSVLVIQNVRSSQWNSSNSCNNLCPKLSPIKELEQPSPKGPKSTTETNNQNNRQSQPITKNLSIRVTVTLLVVIVVLIICYIPDAILSIFLKKEYVTADQYSTLAIREITDFLLVFNSAINFFIYCKFSRSFRVKFEEKMRKLRKSSSFLCSTFYNVRLLAPYKKLFCCFCCGCAFDYQSKQILKNQLEQRIRKSSNSAFQFHSFVPNVKLSNDPNGTGSELSMKNNEYHLQQLINGKNRVISLNIDGTQTSDSMFKEKNTFY
ncbi:hypothetical protein SNEBB_010460 [Seison nebaliae]|nr:hypothetical protein SNEBB_010460 [Seison nebaliae]